MLSVNQGRFLDALDSGVIMGAQNSRAAADPVDGAEFVSGDVEGRTATFTVVSEAALASLKETLAEAGYPAN